MPLLTNLHVDWISVTYPGQYPHFPDQSRWKTIDAYPTTIDKTKWRVSRPLNGYTYGYTSDNGTMALSGPVGMGLHIMYSGQAIENMRMSSGVSAEAILIHHAQAGAKATRIDIAIDLLDGNDNMNDFERWCNDKKYRSCARKWRAQKESDGGHTIYFGARTSERMVRVYNKIAERANKGIIIANDAWVRVECEFKEDRAKMLLKACLDNPVSEVLLAHIVDAIDFPLSEDYQAAIKNVNTAIEVQVLRRKDTQTRHWLLSTVAQTLANECKDDPDFLDKFISEVKNIQKLC